MNDTEKVISGMEHCGVGLSAKQCDGCPYASEMNCDTIVYADALALLREQQEQIDRLIEENASNAEMAEGLKELLKEQKEKLESVCCFENGDQVRTWHCPFCKSEVRLVLKDWNVIEDHLLGIKKVVERPQDIRVVTDDGRVIVLNKEVPTMVLGQKDWSDYDA